MSRNQVIAAVITLVLAIGAWQMIRLQRSVHTYEQTYVDCMEIKKSYTPGYQIPYPSQAYTDATEDCHRQASAR